jgi:hypothetical protein
MKWLQPWLAKAYASLYAEKHENWIEFEEAKAILGIMDKRVLSLRLTRLEEGGFLISKRDSIDRRKKYFRLIQPNDAVFSYGIQPFRGGDVVTRLAASAKYMDFVVGGSYAAHVHSGYASPAKVDVYVRKEDAGKWIALLSDRATAVSVDDVLSEKASRENVHIHTSLTREMVDDSLLLDGIRYLRAESLVIDGLREQTEFSLTDAFSILIKKRGDIDFNRLVKLAQYENLSRELGACLEIINTESGRKVFDDRVIMKMRSKKDLTRKRFFPRDKMEESKEYKEISEKWGLRISLTRAFVSKIITDLVR